MIIDCNSLLDLAEADRVSTRHMRIRHRHLRVNVEHDGR